MRNPRCPKGFEDRSMKLRDFLVTMCEHLIKHPEDGDIMIGFYDKKLDDGTYDNVIEYLSTRKKSLN